MHSPYLRKRGVNRIKPKVAHGLRGCCEPLLERFVAETEVECMRAFFHRTEKQLAQEHFSGGMTRQLDVECRLVPHEHTIIGEAEMKRDGPVLGLQAREPQPAGRRSRLG